MASVTSAQGKQFMAVILDSFVSPDCRKGSALQPQYSDEHKVSYRFSVCFVFFSYCVINFFGLYSH